MRQLLSASLLLITAGSNVVVDAGEVTEQVSGDKEPARVDVTSELIAAQHALQLAQLRWQQYQLVELPRQRQLLDDQVRMVAAEVDILERRLRDYRPFLQVGRYSPVRTAAENDRLALLLLQQQLRLLRDARINHMRHSRPKGRLYQLEVLRTAVRVRELLANTSATH